MKAVEGWPTRQLRELADIRVSNVDKKFYASEKPVKLCNYMDVYANEYVTGNIQFMEASATPAEIEQFSLNRGDVIITKDSETPDDIGIPAVIAEEINDLVCGYHLALIRPNQEYLDPVYLAKQLCTSDIVRYFAVKASGSTRFGLSIGAIETVEIPTPPKPEQTKIAEIFSTVDRAIEQTEALIAKQQRIKTGLMQDLLTRGIDEHGNLRSEQTHKFKDSPLGRIPVGWEVKSLGQVSNLITNGFVGIATPHYTESSDGIPYLYGNNIRSNHINIKKVTYVTQKFHSRQHKSQLFPGDMLTVQSGHIGTTAIVPKSLGVSNCHALIITKFKKDILNPHFVSFYCNFCLETGSMFHLFIGSTIKHINTSDFAKFAIPFPSKKEQSNIVDRLFDIGRNSYATEGNLTKLRSLKTSLMQDLLTGKKRVTALLNDTEVASL
jgi:type I restriction enzyme S subunit